MNKMRFVLPILLLCAWSIGSESQALNAPGSDLSGHEAIHQWPVIQLANPDNVQMTGPLGTALERGVNRLANAPYTTDWLLADVSFKVDRIFTNYSGDVSGRFLELATLTSRPGELSPRSTLPAFLRSVTKYQKADGHFGVNVDFSQPLKKGSRGITLLWGNARMLVGLVTASRRLDDPKLLEAAKRLGDFYVRTQDQLCSPAREAEYHATGTAADSYQVCYFPAMEGLVMLYQQTQDQRYLELAERMAKFFLKFDVLPDDHSHGNLSAWRSILDLYNVTGKRAYLDEAIAKWSKAVDGGFVWVIGGVGEHWHISYNGSEGCSESDWLRFNLDLWRYTGQTRYLDMAERLLKNQYVADQASNGGFGMRHFDTGASGPVATFGGVDEWDFCCSFHGPLGLYFLQSYLATGSKQGIYVNFPFDFSSTVPAGGTQWKIESSVDADFDSHEQKRLTVTLTPAGKPASAVTIRLRAPSWSRSATIGDSQAPAKVEDGYVVLASDAREGGKYVVTFRASPRIEARKFTAEDIDPGRISYFQDVSIIVGSKPLFEVPARGPELSNLLAMVDEKGTIDLLRNADGSYVSVKLPGPDATAAQVQAALESGRKVSLLTWPVQTSRRAAFAYNVVLVPKAMISDAERSKFAARPMESEIPHYGSDLEKQPDLWPATPGWKFGPEGILITRGDVGLIEGQGYGDYRFEFDVMLPEAGQGITGWIVRARDESNCMMFQLQSRDSQYNDPRYKTRPNTLRPISRHNGSWHVQDPIPLKTELRRGGTYHVITDCRGDQIKITINGEKAYDQKLEGMESGAVGFRVGEPLDQGLFTHISLKKL